MSCKAKLLFWQALTLVFLCLPKLGQAQKYPNPNAWVRPAPVVREPPVSKAEKDSLVHAFRQIKKRLRRMNRVDEFTDNKDRPIRYNIVKVDVPNWCFREPNLGYERKISHHATVMLHGAYFSHEYRRETDTSQTDPDLDLIHRAFYPGQYTLPDINTRTRTLKLVPEVRAYIGKNAPRGFFLGAYYYFNCLDWHVQAHSRDSTGQAIVSNGLGRLVLQGPGVVWGFQSIVGTRVSLGFEMGGAWLLGQKIERVQLSPRCQAPRNTTVIFI